MSLSDFILVETLIHPLFTKFAWRNSIKITPRVFWMYPFFIPPLKPSPQCPPRLPQVSRSITPLRTCAIYDYQLYESEPYFGQWTMGTVFLRQT